ncbi:3948_t:CDS:2 [Dentiscutata erythropus]|uniref:3948_t:CDS:1 n=1 Tax=Dentiscutata erythropus TaxID=1348616 RepID=A0A9N8W5W3_9GLOM|nr:3948_t:CDS:2 [Dentiscutata erythropus]
MFHATELLQYRSDHVSVKLIIIPDVIYDETHDKIDEALDYFSKCAYLYPVTMQEDTNLDATK